MKGKVRIALLIVVFAVIAGSIAAPGLAWPRMIGGVIVLGGGAWVVVSWLNDEHRRGADAG